MNFLASSEPLEDEDIEFIESKLEKYNNPGSMFSISELDGFLTAVVSGPRMIRPSEWLPHIWGGEDEDPAWDSMEEFQGFLSRVTQLMNYTAETLSEYQDEFEPICLFENRKDAEDVPIFDLWCFGYVKGMNINIAEWEELEREDDVPLRPILELASYCIEGPPEDRTTKHEKFLVEVIPKCALEIYDFWLERRKPMSGQSINLSDLPLGLPKEPFTRTSAKIGPNEPCPCGSGRKYKKCCQNKERETPTYSPPSKLFDADSFTKPVSDVVEFASKKTPAPDEHADEEPRDEDEDFELEMSPLGRFLEKDGKTVEICIYRDDDETWILEFEDEGGGSTVFDGFKTDKEAYDFAIETVDKEGIDYVIVEKED